MKRMFRALGYGLITMSLLLAAFGKEASFKTALIFAVIGATIAATADSMKNQK